MLNLTLQTTTNPLTSLDTYEPPIAVQIESLSVSLRGVNALHDLSLTVAQGEFVLMSGPSGSGKSTLARTLAGLLREQPGVTVEGAVRVDGLDILGTPSWQVAQHVGIVFQNPRAQLFNLTVDEELACGPRNLGLDERTIQERVDWTVDALELEHLLGRRLDTLSGGEMQRVAIGAILAMGADVLLLDEPTSSLDVTGTRQVSRALERLHRERGTTILLIEHRLGEVAHLASRVVLLESGQIVADGPCDVVFGDRALMRHLGMRRPAPEPADDWAHLLQPNGAHSTDEQPLLVLENIEAGYGRKTILKDVNLSFWPGEFVALVGENGAGKSTLSMVMAGLLKPQRGSVTFNGQRKKKLGLDVGLLFQNPLDQLFCDTVDEEVAFGPENYACYRPDLHAQTLDECDLTSVRARPIYALSAGQQQRVALGAVLALRPALLILDEPTLGQDWGHLEQLMDYLCQLNQQRTTIVMITHDYKLVHRYAHRVVLLHEGRIVVDGVPVTK